MSATLLPPRTSGTGDRGPTGPDRPAVPDDGRGRGRRRPGRRALAVLLTATALLGGGGAGAVVLTGAAEDGDPTATTTVAQPSSSDTSDSFTTSLDAGTVYESASPGVVEITASGTGSAQPDPFGQGSSESSATGSGFVVDSEGHIITAAHVVDGAGSLQVTFSDGTTRSATLTGKDDATDVAVLKVDPSGLTLHPLELGSSAALDVGDAVAAIGSPFGYEDSLSTGVVSRASTARSRRPTASPSRTRSRSTRRSTPATPAARSWTPAAASSAWPTRSRPTAHPSRAPASASRCRSTSSSMSSMSSRPARPSVMRTSASDPATPRARPARSSAP